MDTAGTEKYRSIYCNYYRDVDAALLFYDITLRRSLEELQFWISELKKYSNKPLVYIL